MSPNNHELIISSPKYNITNVQEQRFYLTWFLEKIHEYVFFIINKKAIFTPK